MKWKQLVAYITGSVDQELLLRNEYFVTENRMLRQQIRGRVRLSDSDRKTLAAMGKKLGKQALEEVATIVKPDTILAWHRKLVAQKCDSSQQRKPPGRPKIDSGLEALVVRLAREHRTWGYDRMVGALRQVGYTISDQTVGNSLKSHGIPPASERKRNATMADWGMLSPGHYLLHDRERKFCPAFQRLIDDAGVTRVMLPPQSPKRNADAERWVPSVKEEALSRLRLCGERALWHRLQAYVTPDHQERLTSARTTSPCCRARTQPRGGTA